MQHSKALTLITLLIALKAAWLPMEWLHYQQCAPVMATYVRSLDAQGIHDSCAACTLATNESGAD